MYPQCVPGDGHQPHLLTWTESAPVTRKRDAQRGLSESELMVLVDAAEGLSTAESATRRFKGRETIKTQRGSVLVKLQARNMTHAVAVAVADGLISVSEAA